VVDARGKKAREIMVNADKLLNDDWEKTKQYLSAKPFPLLIERQLLEDRDYYKGLVKEVVEGLEKNPPTFRPADENAPTEGGGVAYVEEKGGPINLRKAFFNEDAEQQPYTIIHEYGRVYLWDKLSATPENRAIKGDIGNWDDAIRFLGQNYEKIIATK
jgi:hypothetical protein